jgi:hypothetical protein
MFVYEKNGNSLEIEIDGTDYLITRSSVKKWNYINRDENSNAVTEKVEADELEKLVITLSHHMYEQNKSIAKTIVSGV